MRDIRTDWHWRDPADRIAREDIAPTVGARLIVSCEAGDCEHAVLMDPRPIFGARRYWPVEGRSERFRCRCGSRETTLSYTINTAQRDGPMSKAAIRLWT
ncbi:hypothetical protein BH09PSE1_BH09PSE1_02670 [soil metagenome]